MKQVRIHGADDVRIDEIPAPQAGPRDVLLRVDACGICATDVSLAHIGGLTVGGQTRGGFGQPMALGHEAAGTVLAAGSEVDGISPGMRLVINPMADGDNIIGAGGSEGAFCDVLLVRDAELERTVFAIPDHLPSDVAALTEPLAVALHTVNRCAVQPHEKAVVFGCGPIGLGVIAWLKRRGLQQVVAVDLAAERLQRARDLGADVISDGEQLLETLRASHGAESFWGQTLCGTDLYIDAVGSAAIVQRFIEFAKPHARLVCVGMYKAEVPVDFMQVGSKELSMTGCVAYSPAELSEVVRTLGEDGARFAPMISHRFPLDEFEQAFRTAQMPHIAAKVMIERNSAP